MECQTRRSGETNIPKRAIIFYQGQKIRTKHQLLIKALKNCIPFRNIIKYIQIGREPADLWDAKTRDAIETNTPKRGILFPTGNQIITMH